MLDKVTDSGYNIHTGYREVSYLDYTKDKEGVSALNETDLNELSDALNKISPTHGLTPIIAGGSIRDLMYGYTPKDFDVFIDVSHIEDADELSDTIDSFMYDMCIERRGPDFERAVGWPYAIVNEAGMSPQYKDMEDSFVVKEWNPSNTKTWANYQFIFMKEPLITSDPGQWILQRFDYSQVKCFMDPKTKKVYASDQFIKDFGATRIDVQDDTGAKRVRRWAQRTGHNITPVIYAKANDANNKTKSPTVPKMFLDGRLQHPKKWVG